MGERETDGGVKGTVVTNPKNHFPHNQILIIG